MELLRVPSLAENIETVTIGKWLVTQGQNVSAGDEVVGLLTEKADFNLECSAGGTISKLLYPERSTVPVGAILCVLDGSAENIARAEEENQSLGVQPSFTPPSALADPVTGQGAAPSSDKAGKVRATPAARRLAKEHGLDLAALAAECGTTVREEHVRAHLEK